MRPNKTSLDVSAPNEASDRRVHWLLVIALLSGWLGISDLRAATFVVNHTGDIVDAAPGNGVCDTGDGITCTLRAAVQEANALAGADTINLFLPGQVHALVLDGYENAAATGDLDILEDLTIHGNAGFVDAGFLVSVDNVFDIRTGPTVAIHDLTIQNGSNGIYADNGTSLSLINTTVQSSVLTGITINASYGGSASVDLSASTITQNGTLGIQANGPVQVAIHSGSALTQNACGIYLNGGNGGSTLSVTDSLVQGNAGSYGAGGINVTTSYFSPTIVSISGSQILGNSTSNTGGVGGLSVKPSSGGPDPTVTVSQSSFQNNAGTAVGALFAYGNITITNSHFESNTATAGFTPAPGGVAFSIGITGGPLASVSNSTFRLNSGVSGALVSQQPLNLTNSTFSANAATQANNAAVSCRTASAICNFDHITVTETTGVGGLGILVSSPATITLSNSISANNTNPDCAGTITSAGYNLIENVGCGLIGDTTGNIHLMDPELQPLADNGGSTLTHALSPTSPALDGGPLSSIGGSQNGVSRPADGDGDGTAHVDIGAFELPEPSLDFGDAPDPLVATGGEYPTLLANDGARHQIAAGVYLGSTIDDETDGQPSADGLGDDQQGSDDEDGVVLTSLLVPGAMTNVTVTASVAGVLHAWIDFDADGIWDPVDDVVFDNQALAPGDNNLAFSVPGDAIPGNTFARFRFDSAGLAATSTGAAPDGEVEDYRFAIEPAADLILVKSGPGTAVPGATIDYTLVASNPSGPANVLGALVGDNFPAELFGCGWNCNGAGGGACSSSSGSGSLNEPVDLPVGGSVTFLVTCSIDPAEIGTVTNSATVSPPAGIVDPNGTNNSSEAMTTLEPAADLAIHKTDGQTVIEPPDSLTYTIVAENLGPSDVLNAQIEDLFPTQVTNVDWTCVESAGGICGTSAGMGDIILAADLPVGGSVTLTATGSVTDPTPVVITNTATVSSSVDDPVSGNDSDSDDTEVVTDTTVIFIDGFESGDLGPWIVDT